MSRAWTPFKEDRERTVEGAGDDFVLRSRADAKDRLRNALQEARGPALVTGEAGVGKTWLWRKASAELPRDWRSVGVDLSPANDPADVHRLIGYALGLGRTDTPGAVRMELADFLQDGVVDGLHWVLVVDEAHTVSVGVLEELRILANRLGKPDGFAGMILVGQTSLARRLATPALGALAARISDWVHLRNVDLEESRSLVDGLIDGLAWDETALEIAHRDTRGNPKRLLHIAREAARSAPAGRRVNRQSVASPPPAVSVEPTSAEPASVPLLPVEASWDLPVLGDGKPPLFEEEGLIEVGWEPAPRMSKAASTLGSSAEFSESAELESEEMIEDHYAALQAWNEWSQNQGRIPAAVALDASEIQGELALSDDSGESTDWTPIGSNPSAVRAEGQHGFAPYGQLFTRLKQTRDSIDDR